MPKLRDLTSSALWGLFRLFPIDKRKILFSSYYGRGFSDNPKAIAQALLNSGRDLKLQWLVRSPQEAQSLPAGIQPVPCNGLRRMFAVSTAKVWVDNCRKYERNKRPGQFYMQTWHGFALKRIEKDAADALEPEYIKGCIRDSQQTDLIVSNSAFMTDIYRRSFWYSGEVAEFGSPRNDVFFHPDPQTHSKVRDSFGLPHGQKLLLYAPTFRGNHSTEAYALDAEAALAACEARFGGSWTALIRLHPNVAEQSQGLFPYDGRRILDATSYPDMQELLSGVELLITDYSSSMFDYALQEKPCIQFSLDMEAYKNDRNFYFAPDTLPFPLAQSNEELQAVILNYDEDRCRALWQDFTEKNGFCEDGHAAQRCAQWILHCIDDTKEIGE